MNRSILIVICDFLLVSLLAFSTTDIRTITNPGAPMNINLKIAPSQVASTRQDMADVMKLALTEEHKGKEQLLSDLKNSRDAAIRQETALNEKQKQVESVQQQLTTRQQEEAKLQAEQANLQKQYASAQTDIQSLNLKLADASKESQLSRQSLAATQAEVKQKADAETALQHKLDDLAKQHQQALDEKQKLNGQLQVAEAEKRSATDLANRLDQEVKVERAEKAKLADGVTALATRSGELEKQIRENTPLAPNTIFDDFLANRVQADFDATRPAVAFGEKHRQTQTILVTDNTNTFALCHVTDTPLVLWTPGTDWDGLTGSLMRSSATVPIKSLAFYLLDPRVVLMPLTADEAKQLGGKVYHLSKDPYKFQDAVVVGARDGYYGQCNFEMDLSTPQYVRMDRNSLKGLFGKFNPSRGDLVISRTGDLLGVMANSTYCMLIQNLDVDMSIKFGPDVREQHTGSTLSILASLVTQKPFKLQ